jgi:hypothetical protein
MEHDISYWVLKVFVWGAIWAIVFEAIGANNRLRGSDGED